MLRRIQVRRFLDDCLSGCGVICGGLSELGSLKLPLVLAGRSRRGNVEANVLNPPELVL